MKLKGLCVKAECSKDKEQLVNNFQNGAGFEGERKKRGDRIRFTFQKVHEWSTGDGVGRMLATRAGKRLWHSSTSLASDMLKAGVWLCCVWDSHSTTLIP